MRRIVVSDLADETYRARIVLSRGEDDYDIDARPSDAIALAVRVSAPIFATDAVLDRAAVMPEADEEERLSVFREFVNSLDADFGRPRARAAPARGRSTSRLTTGPARIGRRASGEPDEGA